MIPQPYWKHKLAHNVLVFSPDKLAMLRRTCIFLGTAIYFARVCIFVAEDRWRHLHYSLHNVEVRYSNNPSQGSSLDAVFETDSHPLKEGSCIEHDFELNNPPHPTRPSVSQECNKRECYASRIYQKMTEPTPPQNFLQYTHRTPARCFEQIWQLIAQIL